jgi:replicative DNA helicase
MRTQNYLQAIEERGLPCDLNSERLILGSMLLDSEGFMPAVLETLNQTDFSTESHRLIFQRSKEQFQNSGRVDRVTLAHALFKGDELESVGGMSYLCSLDDGLPRLPNLDGYLRIVRDSSLKRRAIIARHHRAPKSYHRNHAGPRGCGGTAGSRGSVHPGGFP